MSFSGHLEQPFSPCLNATVLLSHLKSGGGGTPNNIAQITWPLELLGASAWNRASWDVNVDIKIYQMIESD